MDKRKHFPIHQMALSNIEAWARSPRTILMLIFIVTICYLEASAYGQTFQSMGRPLHWDELFFYAMSTGCNIRITSVLFLVTVSELPRQMAYQYQHLIRTSRIKWLLSQWVYCIWTVLFIQVAIALFLGLFLIPYASPGSGWTEPALISAGIISDESRIIPAYICDNLSTLQANLIAQLPIFTFRLTMVFVILLLSLCGNGLLGVISYVFILMAERTILVEAFYGIVLPTNFSAMAYIAATFTSHEWVNAGSELSSIAITLTGYAVVAFGLMLLMVIRTKYCDLSFDGSHN